MLRYFGAVPRRWVIEPGSRRIRATAEQGPPCDTVLSTGKIERRELRSAVDSDQH
ncbi:hypothetical protein GCM10023317_94350 [Actinopolymorpha pittospori]